MGKSTAKPKAPRLSPQETHEPELRRLLGASLWWMDRCPSLSSDNLYAAVRHPASRALAPTGALLSGQDETLTYFLASLGEEWRMLAYAERGALALAASGTPAAPRERERAIVFGARRTWIGCVRPALGSWQIAMQASCAWEDGHAVGAMRECEGFLTGAPKEINAAMRPLVAHFVPGIDEGSGCGCRACAAKYSVEVRRG